MALGVRGSWRGVSCWGGVGYVEGWGAQGVLVETNQEMLRLVNKIACPSPPPPPPKVKMEA